jgi:hypothetical protein
MRYDPVHKERTRARVLKEAAKAIRAESPHRIGVAGVTAKAGLTHGGFTFILLPRMTWWSPRWRGCSTRR